MLLLKELLFQHSKFSFMYTMNEISSKMISESTHIALCPNKHPMFAKVLLSQSDFQYSGRLKSLVVITEVRESNASSLSILNREMLRSKWNNLHLSSLYSTIIEYLGFVLPNPGTL